VLASLLVLFLSAASAPPVASAPVPPTVDSVTEPVRDQAIYFHPTMMVLSLGDSDLPWMIPVTYEREIGAGHSWVLETTLMDGSVRQSNYAIPGGGYDIAPEISILGLEMIGSRRNYFNGQVSKGWYWAPALLLEYLHASQPAKMGEYVHWDAESVDAFGIGGLAYIGYRAKWGGFTMFFDVGLGCQIVTAQGDASQSIVRTGLAEDFNIGLGRAF
jgi:hypothetical protein